MRQSIATLIRRIAAAFEPEFAKDLIKEIITPWGKRNKELADRSMHPALAKELSAKTIELADKRKGHGLSEEKYEEFTSRVKDLEKANDVRAMIKYITNFVMAGSGLRVVHEADDTVTILTGKPA
jgi:hypothetical protein